MSERDLSSHESHHDAIRREYKKQAPYWSRRETSSDLQWAVDNLDPQSELEVLDVAAGTGLLARAIAPHVQRVVASDITPEMQSLGAYEAEQEGITNIAFEPGEAENLPYPDSVFDMVVTRFSVHHFLEPQAVIAEMGRVCRPGGRVAVIDMTAPEQEELAARYNELEHKRDRTHTRALSARELRMIVEDAGLKITGRYDREVEVNLERWLDSAEVVPPERGQILAAINQELEGSTETGLRPFVREGERMFKHLWEMVVAEKPTEQY